MFSFYCCLLPCYGSVCSVQPQEHLTSILLWISNSKEDSPKYSLAICYATLPCSSTQQLAFWGYRVVSIVRTAIAFQSLRHFLPLLHFISLVVPSSENPSQVQLMHLDVLRFVSERDSGRKTQKIKASSVETFYVLNMDNIQIWEEKDRLLLIVKFQRMQTLFHCTILRYHSQSFFCSQAKGIEGTCSVHMC